MMNKWNVFKENKVGIIFKTRCNSQNKRENMCDDFSI